MEAIKELSYILAEIRDEALIKKIFKSILTKNELKTISLRWELVKLLDKGVSQRKISKDLKLSLCKITRGSKELKKPRSILKKILNNYVYK